MFAAIAGALAGMLHVVTGPDHLAAVAPLAARHPGKALKTGAAWGLGHAAGVLLLGGLGVVARRWIRIEALSGWAELFVGGVLLGVGLWALWQARGLVVHEHEHQHDHAPHGANPSSHAHAHIHVDGTHHASGKHGRHAHAAFGVGMLHGAAGTGHLLGVLPSLALPPVQAVVYLVSYGVAAVGAMALFGLLVGKVGSKLRGGALRGLMTATGVFAVALGGYWLWSGWPPGG